MRFYNQYMRLLSKLPMILLNCGCDEGQKFLDEAIDTYSPLVIDFASTPMCDGCKAIADAPEGTFFVFKFPEVLNDDLGYLLRYMLKNEWYRPEGCPELDFAKLHYLAVVHQEEVYDIPEPYYNPGCVAITLARAK